MWCAYWDPLIWLSITAFLSNVWYIFTGSDVRVEQVDFEVLVLLSCLHPGSPISLDVGFACFICILIRSRWQYWWEVVSLIMYTRRISPGCHFDVGVDIIVSDKFNDGIEFISDLGPDFFRWSECRQGGRMWYWVSCWFFWCSRWLRYLRLNFLRRRGRFPLEERNQWKSGCKRW